MLLFLRNVAPTSIVWLAARPLFGHEFLAAGKVSSLPMVLPVLFTVILLGAGALDRRTA